MISDYKSISAYPRPPRCASTHRRGRGTISEVTDVDSASTVVFLPPPKANKVKRLQRLARSGTDAITDFPCGESGTLWRRGRSRHLKWTVEDQSIATHSSSVNEKPRHKLPGTILRSRRGEIEPLNAKSGPSHLVCATGADPGPSHTNADSAVSAETTREKSTRFRSLPSAIEGIEISQKGAGVRDGAESVPRSSRSGPSFRCQTDSGTDKTSSNSSFELTPAEQAALRLHANRSSRALPIAQPRPQATIVAALVEGSSVSLISPGQGRCSNTGAHYSSRLDDGTSWTETLLRSLAQREQDLTREVSHFTPPASPDGYVRRAVGQEDVASVEELQRLRLEEEEREYLSGPFSLGSTSVGLALRCQAGEEPLQHPEEGFPAGSQEGQSVSRALRAESEVRRMEKEALRLKREKEEDDDGLSVWPVGKDRKAKVRFVTAREAMHIQRRSVSESTAFEPGNKRRRLGEVVGSQESANGHGADGSQTQEEEEISLTPSKKRRRRLEIVASLNVTANENAVLASTSSRSIGDSTCCCQRSRTCRGANADCSMVDQSKAGTSRFLITSPIKTVEADPQPISSTPVLTVLRRAPSSPHHSLRMRELQPIPSYSTGSSGPTLLPAQGTNRSVCRFEFSRKSRSVNDGSSSSICASRRRVSDTSKASDGVSYHATRTTIPDGDSPTHHRHRLTFDSSMTRGKESDAFRQSPEEEEEAASDSHPSRMMRRSSDRDQGTSSKLSPSGSRCVASVEVRAPAPLVKASISKVCEVAEEAKGPSTSRTSAPGAESLDTTLDLSSDRPVPKRPPPVPILPLRSSTSARSHIPSKLAQSLTAESLDRTLNSSALEKRDGGDGSSSAGTTTGAPGHTTTITGLDSIPPPPALHFDPRNMTSLLSILRDPTPFLSAKHGGPMEHCNSPRLNMLLLIREVGPVEEIATKVFRGGKVVEGAREMMARCEMIVMDGEGGMGRVVLWGDCATDWTGGDKEDEDGGDVGGPEEAESSIATHAGMTTTLDGGRGDDTTTYGGVLLKNLRGAERGVPSGQQMTSIKTQTKAKAKTGWTGCLRPGDVICLSSIIISPLQVYPHQVPPHPCGRQAIQIVASPRTTSRVEVCWRWDLPSSRSNRLRHERERRKFRFDEALVDFDRRCRDVWKCAARWEGMGRE